MEATDCGAVVLKSMALPREGLALGGGMLLLNSLLWAPQRGRRTTITTI